MSALFTRSSSNALYCFSDIIKNHCIGNESKAPMVDKIFSIERYQLNSGCAAVTQF